MIRWCCWPVGLLALAPGCYDDHGLEDAGSAPTDAAVDSPSETSDARVPGVDAFGGCVVSGRPVAGHADSPSETRTCVCPGGMAAAIAVTAPAPLAVERGAFVACVPERTYRDLLTGLCPDGLVLHRYQGTPEAALAGVDFSADLRSSAGGCLDVGSCQFADGQLPPELQGGCLYADYSVARTGTLPDVDCAALDFGLCAGNCSCPSDRPQCWGLSEVSPVGICTEGPYCLPGTVATCSRERERECVIIASPPDFADSMVSSPVTGRCAPAAACEALRVATGETWACIPST